MASNTHLIIAAIDFGTTYSGYAYAFRDDLKDIDVKGVQTPIHTQRWINEMANTSTEKTPTSILFAPDGKFNSFGYQAENKYAELADDELETGWKFFKHFKMKLHDSRIRRHTRIKDDQGKSMLALDVFAAAIRYLKDMAFESMTEKVTGLKESDIDWVITVPAIWTYKAKQFMKAAAIEAGLSAQQTSLAHEPETAAIYCMHLEVTLNSDTKGNIKRRSLGKGSQFMVLDLGGGTIDMTACEVQSDGTLGELCPRGGGPWGGIVVNENLYNLFTNAFGEGFMKEFENENKYDHLRLLETLELKKRLTVTPDSTESEQSIGPIRLVLPSEFLTSYERKHKMKLDEAMCNTDHYPYVKRGKICFSQCDFEDAFRESTDKLVKEVKSVMSKHSLKKVKTFMMVGGFAESTIMQKAVKGAFPDKTYIIPKDTSTVVLKGAVLYGFRNASIKSRKLPYTFGIAITEDYDPLKHPSNAIRSRGKVEDIFSPFIRKGAEVTADGIVIVKTFGTALCNAVDIYQTPADDLDGLVLTNDESKKFENIGTIKVTSSRSQLADVRMTIRIFDIEVAARAHGAKRWTKETFDAL